MQSLDHIILNVAGTAVDDDGLMSDLKRAIARIHLGHCGNHVAASASLLRGGGLHRHQPRPDELCRHVGKLHLNSLMLVDRNTERHAFGGITLRLGKRVRCKPHGAGRD